MLHRKTSLRWDDNPSSDQSEYNNPIEVSLGETDQLLFDQGHHIIGVTRFQCGVTNFVTNFVTEFVTPIYTSLGMTFLFRNVYSIDSKRSYGSGMSKNMIGMLHNQVCSVLTGFGTASVDIDLAEAEQIRV